jgi:predicted nuclease with TOPRIM domain
MTTQRNDIYIQEALVRYVTENGQLKAERGRLRTELLETKQKLVEANQKIAHLDDMFGRVQALVSQVHTEAAIKVDEMEMDHAVRYVIRW